MVFIAAGASLSRSADLVVSHLDFLRLREDDYNLKQVIKALKKVELKLLEEEDSNGKKKYQAHTTTKAPIISEGTRLMAEVRKKKGLKFCMLPGDC